MSIIVWQSGVSIPILRVLKLNCAARVLYARRRSTNAALTRLVRAHTVREVVVVRAELLRAVAAHPSAPRAAGDGEGDAAVGTRGGQEGAVVVEVQAVRRGSGGGHGQDRKEESKHFILVGSSDGFRPFRKRTALHTYSTYASAKHRAF